MEYIRLGKTELNVSRTSFGALPIQRTDITEAVRILHKAYDSGINFYDTARFYTDSEAKLGAAFSDRRDKVIIATKSMAATKDQFLKELQQSLAELRTDYVDIMQLHNPSELPDINDENSSLAGMEEAYRRGMIRFRGFTNHNRALTSRAIDLNYFDTIQFPLCMISDSKDWELAARANETDHGVIAMKAMSGGLITNARAAFAFLRQYQYVVPIWGIQFMKELDEFLSFEENPPVLDVELLEVIKKDKKELAEDFCRACGYCMPCPAGIPIPMAARIGLLLSRMPFGNLIGAEWQSKMSLIDKCTECGQCKSRCPYGLDTPNLLKKMKADYDAFVKEKRAE